MLIREGILSVRHRRKLDAFSTSIVLNIAEGNGRFSISDHRTFIDTAHTATFKAAVILDLLHSKRIFGSDRLDDGKHMLGRTVRMLIAMKGYLDVP